MKKTMTDEQLKKNINSVLKTNYPTSLSELGRLMGYGKISGSLTKRIRQLLPKLPEYLEKNKTIRDLDNKPKQTAKKSVKQATKKNSQSSKKNIPPRCKFNGYRPGSDYALCFDLLFQLGRKKPIRRQTLLKAYAKVARKPMVNASYDLAVIVSVRQDGRFHRSADTASRKFPHYVKRIGDAVQLVIKK